MVKLLVIFKVEIVYKMKIDCDITNDGAKITVNLCNVTLIAKWTLIFIAFSSGNNDNISFHPRLVLERSPFLKPPTGFFLFFIY